MICARCNEPIRPGQEYRPVAHHAATGPGAIVYVHGKPSKADPSPDSGTPTVTPVARAHPIK